MSSSQGSTQNEKKEYKKNEAVDLEGAYPQQYVNKMMLEAFGSERFYNFDPTAHANWVN